MSRKREKRLAALEAVAFGADTPPEARLRALDALERLDDTPVAQADFNADVANMSEDELRLWDDHHTSETVHALLGLPEFAPGEGEGAPRGSDPAAVAVAYPATLTVLRAFERRVQRNASYPQARRMPESSRAREQVMEDFTP